MERESSSNLEERYEKIKKSRFKQQKLPAIRPVPTTISTTIIFTSFGILFIFIGIILLISSNKIVEIINRYDDECSAITNPCKIKFELKQEMQAPVMVYYQLHNFYQNHRIYVKSKSNEQLTGNMLSLDTIKKSGACDPVETNSQMGKEFSIDHSPLDPNDIAVPCGLIARSLFNDTFKMYYRGLDGSLEEEIIINEKGIAWEEDVKLKYKNVKNPNNINDTNYYKKVQWIDMTDEHFIVWMRIAGLPNFRKLWGRIEGKQLEKGKYDIIINDNFKVSTFSGKKFFVLTTVNSFGGKNNFLGIAYIVIGCISLIFNFVFLIGFNIYKRKNA